MIKEWLSRWQSCRLYRGHDVYRKLLPGYPELHVERQGDDWVLAFELGRLRGDLPLGTLLLLLGINSPQGTIRVTVDQAGSLVLYTTLVDAGADFEHYDQQLAMLCEHQAFLQPQLQPVVPHRDIGPVSAFA
ncbi:hypothetical protein [Pseudomonas sp. MWU13-3659]|uniref:hypothetical protein n=1 Tax=Pseudomonas sp. MWU13-3659 TaxID=2986964 RepID=UPI0020752D44|nr:hypothetical protein [Pseudomonas sp. MWU13-3659]